MPLQPFRAVAVGPPGVMRFRRSFADSTQRLAKNDNPMEPLVEQQRWCRGDDRRGFSNRHRCARWRRRCPPPCQPRKQMTQQIVIVGAGHAGFQLGASLRQQGFDGTIRLLGDEPHLPYQRPPLSKDYMLGKIGFDLLLMRPEA